MKKRGYDLQKLAHIISMLQEGESLPTQNRDHELVGNMAGFRECHIAPDWLLISVTAVFPVGKNLIVA